MPDWLLTSCLLLVALGLFWSGGAHGHAHKHKHKHKHKHRKH
jgi:hypothetical protein